MIQLEAKRGVDYQILDNPVSIHPQDVDDVLEASGIAKTPRSRIGQYILGGCVAVILTALATSVFAGPVKTIDTGVYVEMVGVDAGYVVEYHNDLSYTVAPEAFELELDGVKAGVSLHLTSGDEPDHIYVVPPIGFWCDPCGISVLEGQVGQIFLYPMGLS